MGGEVRKCAWCDAAAFRLIIAFACSIVSPSHHFSATKTSGHISLLPTALPKMALPSSDEREAADIRRKH